MKHCHRYMLLACVIALAAVLLLPQLRPVLPILMVLCCILPVFALAPSGPVSGPECCSRKATDGSRVQATAAGSRGETTGRRKDI